MSTYCLTYRVWSEKCRHTFGRYGRFNGWVWMPLFTFHGSLPREKEGWRTWLMGVIKSDQEALALYRKEGQIRIFICRSHEKGESRGFRGVWYGLVTRNGIVTEKEYSGLKPIGHMGGKPAPWSRQPWYAQKPIIPAFPPRHKKGPFQESVGQGRFSGS